eukprot:TRINITY_DN4544_c0_g1_i1.p1 TRINITY_DN4544_c0_g1~~TRINITY_DN4544_c0_g1_i1.p1  ORF type:complete len:1238 (+),score=400.75 TRINITY_DN4544_c0_g1_i1:38-3751(+)
MSSFRTDQILERMGQRDPDFRYMAVSDLYNECLKEGSKLDADSENKIVAKLLQMIAEDSSGDVKGMAVKCLAPLSTKVSEKTFGVIIDGPSGLSKNIFSTKKDMEETKDISTIGLKFIIAEVPESATNIINLLLTRLAPKLIEQIQKASAEDTVWYCLDIVNDLLGKWGREMSNEVGCFEKLQSAILPHLSSDNSRARKKAIGCIGYLAVSLPDTLLNNLTEHLVKNAKSAKTSESIQTFIQAIAAISRSVGSRLGKHLKDGIMPLIFKHANNTDADENDSAELAAACEIKDNCFQVLEALLLRCPKDTDKYLEKIEKLSLTFLVWDPLVNEDFDEDEEMQEEFDDDFIDESGEASLGDDDMSWKVRKASARVLSVILKTRPEKLQHLYSSALPTVVSRIGKEREENVKLDLMSTVVVALEQTAIISNAEGDSRSSSSTLKKLSGLVPDIVKGLQKELTGKSPKTKIGAFQLLKELVKVIPDSLDSSVESLIPGIQQGLDDKASSPLKIESLAFLRAFMAHKGAAAVFIPHIQSISTPVLKATSDPYYKINAEALRVLAEIVKILAGAESGFNPESHIPAVFEATLNKLRQLDIDQEVKEGAIECTGLLISLLGDKLSEAQITQCLTILVERLSNEVTRLGTVKTIEQIASSKLKIDLGSVLAAIVKELSGFLRKKSRPLKQASLSALVALIKGHGKSKAAGSSLFEGILKESTPLVSEQDLHLAHLSLLLASSIVHASSSSAENVAKLVLPNAYNLLKSSLLQGIALQSLLKLFKELVTSKSKKVTYDSLLAGLTGIVAPELSRQSFSSIAQCVAVLVANSEAGTKDTIQKFVSDVKSAKSDHQKLLAIFAIGEIGTRVDLSSYADLKKNIVASFDAQSEETKSAASVAFGCIAVGNMTKFLPEILAEIEAHPKRKYLLLGSLREVIVRLSESKEGKENLTGHFESLLTLLFQNTAQEEEGTRNVVSECLGKLALINPNVVPQLRERVADSNLYTRACVTTAIKFTIFEKSLPVDKVLKEHIGAFLDLLSDPEIPVRKAVMLSLNYVAHHKPKIIRDLLGKYLPALYGETKVKKELIKEVDLGPFKHKVDAGIELRQAAFECMYTLMDTCLTKLDLQEFISQLVSGLQDEYDIQMLNHLILIRLAKIAGSALSGGLEQLVEPLKACVTATAKEQAVAQQVERNNELIRSALRAIYSINQIPDVETQPKFAEFMKGTVTQGTLGQTYAEIVHAASER